MLKSTNLYIKYNYYKAIDGEKLYERKRADREEQGKRNMYKILQIEGEVYLPPNSKTRHKFILQILTREKQVRQL